MIDLDEFWQARHLGNSVPWLAASTAEDVYAMHGILPLVNGPRKRVLEIGIGTGGCIEYLAKRHDVTAVDIAPAALERVRHIATTVISSDLPGVAEASIDLAICHLVFQHCDDELVSFLVRNTLKSLSRDGIFSFQFAHLPPRNALNCYVDSHVTLKESIERGTHHFRSKERMMELVLAAGGTVLEVSAPIVWHNADDITWYFFKVGR